MKKSKVLLNEDLSKYTTVRIGGIAETMLVPSSLDELIMAVSEFPNALFIGSGSNLLIANKTFKSVINLREFDKNILNCGNGHYTVGGSVRLQRLINYINSDGYGGIEYLYSVPGLVGGAVVMNAGSGKATSYCISDYITCVTVLENGDIKKLSKEKCAFSHRNSQFKSNSDYVIISVDFQFEKINSEIAWEKKSERIEFCKKTQDNSAPNFGSVFMESNYKIMRFVQKIGFGKSQGVHFSKKSVNWILNNNGGKNSYDDAKKLIEKVRSIHLLLGKKCEVEVITWE